MRTPLSAPRLWAKCRAAAAPAPPCCPPPGGDWRPIGSHGGSEERRRRRRRRRQDRGTGMVSGRTPRCMPGSPLARARSCTGSWDPTDMCVLTVWIGGRQKVRQATKGVEGSGPITYIQTPPLHPPLSRHGRATLCATQRPCSPSHSPLQSRRLCSMQCPYANHPAVQGRCGCRGACPRGRTPAADW